jgi:N-acetylglutamate synthase-like GNAT family acetyltransferase
LNVDGCAFWYVIYEKSLKEIRQEFSQQVFLNALEEGQIVGSVRAYLEKGTAYIGRLMVKPDSENKGIGTRLMQAIEEHFRMADRYELFTGHRSTRDLYLYRKLGYREFKRVPVNDLIVLVFLGKYRLNGITVWVLAQIATTEQLVLFHLFSPRCSSTGIVLHQSS